MQELEQVVSQAYHDRARLKDADTAQAVERVIAMLDRG